MNKKDYKLFSQYRGLDNDPCAIADPAPVKSDSDFDRILSTIFAVDPVSGLPMTDIVYYLSPNGDPQVREWLVNNLLQPRATASGKSIEGVTDEMIFEFSRKPDESLENYAGRIASIRQEAIDYINAHKDVD